MSDLIDTTEMYLKSIMEVLEEGAVPLRARIAERLGHSGPTVSQTVARMERDGLLTVGPDRRIVLTPAGHELGVRVLRKHRLVERLLTEVIGLEWHLVHDEACRWEHVVSDEVEQRLVHLLSGEAVDPFGNPIPGLEELGGTLQPVAPAAGNCSLDEFVDALGVSSGPGGGGEAARAEGGTDTAREVDVRVVSLGEALQADAELLAALADAGVRPGAQVRVRFGPADEGVYVGGVEMMRDERRHLRVAPLSGV